MEINEAEEETLEAIKQWWEENGTALTVVVATVALVWGGWTFWQNSRESTISEASDRYEEILELSATATGEPPPEADRARIVAIADELKYSHGDTTYARYAALFAAQQAVLSNDLEAAEAQLRWVLDNTGGGLFSEPDTALIMTASLRLGRILLAQGEPDQALALIEELDPGTFEAEFAELRGDIYVSQGRLVDARDAYTTALQSAGGANSFLQMNLDELANVSG